MTTYMQAIGLGFPGVGCHSIGDTDTYESIEWCDGLPLPSKEVLDTWIVDHPDVTQDETTLTDGSPAYYKGVVLIGTNITTLVFTVKSPGAKKYNIPFFATGEAYVSDRNRMLLGFTVAYVGGPFDIVLKLDGTEHSRYSVSSQNYIFKDLDILITAGQTVGFSVDATTNISNPVVLLEAAARN